MPNFYLLKRSPGFASNGVIVKRSVPDKGYSENSLNKKPPSTKLMKGDRIFVSETAYGIYASGVVTHIEPIVEFRTVEEIINYYSEHRLKDEAYWFNMVRKLNAASPKKPSVLYYQSFTVDLTLLDQVRPLAGGLSSLAKIQNSLTSLEASLIDEIENYQSDSLAQLDGKIPGYLRLDLYSMFNKRSNLGTWIDVDHFVPKSVGGPGNIAENLIPVGFSLNRYKGNSIPKGLFIVAGKDADLKQFVKHEFLKSTDSFFRTADAREAARKILSQVHTRSVSDARQFYLNVMQEHHPEYAELIKTQTTGHSSFK